MGTITQSIANNLTTGLGGASGVNFRNIIINGDMSIAQRGTSFIGQTGANYIVDRFTQSINGAIGTWTNGQSTEVPTGQGFANSLIMDCTTADASPAASDILWVQQKIEGQNLQYLKKGTANAESTTLSFWVKSNKTGTYIAELEDRDNTRYVSQSYTISSANTWEKKTVTFPGDTTGAFDNDNAESLRLNFWLGAGTDWSSGTLGTTWHTTNANRAVGQVNLADDTANEWYITGVQLEAGTTASDFEFLPVDVNLARCQRYYYLHTQRGGSFEPLAMGYYFNSTNLIFLQDFPVQMRSHPSLVAGSGTDYYRFDYNNTNDLFNSLTLSMSYNTNALFYNNSEVSGTGGMAGGCYLNSDGAFLAFDSEL